MSEFHRDNLPAEWGVGRDELPCILGRVGDERPFVLVGRPKIVSCRGSVDALETALREALGAGAGQTIFGRQNASARERT